MAQQTLEIIEQGRYASSAGEVDLSPALARCLAGTRLYDDAALNALELEAAAVDHKEPAPKIEVTAETSLSAARRLVERGLDTLCLNFASAKNPGGGFLGGAEAQEESLARASGLYASLLSQRAYYDANRASESAFYTEHLIYSPAVPVFRDESGQLLERPYLTSFITMPAVNAGLVRSREPERVAAIETVMRRRVLRVLALAERHGHRGLGPANG